MPNVYIPALVPASTDVLEAFRPLVQAVVYTAMRGLHAGEERRQTCRNGYGEGGFNPTLRERRGRER